MSPDTRMRIQLQEMADADVGVKLASGFGADYECTLYYDDTHGHFGGHTVVDAVQRAYTWWTARQEQK